MSNVTLGSLSRIPQFPLALSVLQHRPILLLVRFGPAPLAPSKSSAIASRHNLHFDNLIRLFLEPTKSLIPGIRVDALLVVFGARDLAFCVLFRLSCMEQ